MTVKSLSRFVLALTLGLFAWTTAASRADAGACAAAKSKANCTKNADCSWNGKACAAKGAAKGAKKETAKAPKANGKGAAKAAKAAKGKAAPKTTPKAEPAPVPVEENPMVDEEPIEDEGEAPVEGEEDF